LITTADITRPIPLELVLPDLKIYFLPVHKHFSFANLLRPWGDIDKIPPMLGIACLDYHLAFLQKFDTALAEPYGIADRAQRNIIEVAE
jgi:hypothetical protein